MTDIKWVRLLAFQVEPGMQIKLPGPAHTLVRTVKDVRVSHANWVIIRFTGGKPWQGPHDFPFERLEVA